MNRAYRLVWSHTRRTWIAASETAHRRGKNGGGRTLINTIAAALVLAGATPGPAIAGLLATYTWSGGAGTSNWGDVTNWNPNGFPSTFPSDMSTDPDWDKLIFGGAAGGTLNNNVGPYSIGLEFSSGAGAYTLTSTGFDISVVGISNLSSSMQTISMNVNKHKNIDATYDAGAGGLTINGNFNISSWSNYNVTFTGSANTTITGNVNAAGSTLTKTGTGTLAINGQLGISETDIVINQGTLSLASSSGNYQNTLTFNGGTLKATGTFTLSADTTINSGGGTIDTGSNTVTLSNNISGTGALTKTGSGTLVLSGTNNYSGGTTVSAGTLQGTTSGLQGNISNSGSVVFNQDTDGTYTGNVSGTGSLSKSGSGVVTLSGSNSYSGGTTVTGGTLRSGSASAFASNKAFTVNGGTLDLNGYALTMSSLSGTSGAVTLGSAALTVNQSSTSSYAGNITGTGSLTKQGSGTLTLSGTNTYSGGTTVSAGTLQSGSASAFANNKDFTVNGGTLDLNSNDLTMRSLSGSGGSVVLGSAALTAYQNSNTTYTGNISGTGTLTKTGVGTLTLSGSNTYSGGTTVAEGTLRSGSASAFASNTAYTVNGGTLNLNDNDLTMSSLSGSGGRILIGNAALTVNQSTNTTYAGDMIGTGTLTKQGNGTLTLSGTNTYSGGTTVSAGTLQSGSANAFVANSAYTVNGGTLDLNGHALTMSSLSGSGGAVTLGSAALTLNQSSNTSYAGNISGAGSLIKQGTGTLTLMGTNSYSGGTTISIGTLQSGSASAFASNTAYTVNGGTLDLNGNALTMSALSGSGGTVTLGGATLTINQSTDTTYDGTISGTGGLNKFGTGILILNGSNSFPGSTTTISSGTLEVGDANHSGASLASEVFVASGATLRGHGTVTGGITNSGSLRPGGSIGSLTVNGSVAFNSGSTFDVDVSPTVSSRLNVTGAPGTAAINSGATVNVLAETGNYNLSTQYTILNATGGVTGTFGSVSSNLAFLTPSLSYDSNNVYLKLARNDVNFSGVAVSPNQQAVARTLEAINAAGATGDMQTQLSSVFGLSAAQARRAYDSLSGAGLNTFYTAQQGFMGGFADAIGSHMAGGMGGGLALSASPIRLAAASTTVSDVLPDYGFRPVANRGLWVQAYGNTGHTDSDGNSAAYDLSGGGLALGVDRPLDSGWRVGAALTYGEQTFSSDWTSGTTKGAAAAVYGHYSDGPWSVKLLGAIGRTRNESERSVVIGNTRRTASANFNGNQQSVYAETGYALPVGRVTVQALAALAYTHVRNPGYTESGADALNLQVKGQSRDSLRSYLGARLLMSVGDLRIEPRLIWTHQFGNIDRAPLAASFAGGPAVSFESNGTEASRDGAQLGLRLVKSSPRGFSFYLDVSADMDNRRTNGTLVAGLQRVW